MYIAWSIVLNVQSIIIPHCNKEIKKISTCVHYKNNKLGIYIQSNKKHYKNESIVTVGTCTNAEK